MLKGKIAYCWELGAGLGHVTRIDSICNRPEFANTKFSFILKDINKASYISKAIKRNVYAAPAFTHSPPLYRSPNYAHIMLRCGWQNKDCAYDLVLNWLDLLKKLQPQFVFCDYAPTAAIAAKLLNIPFLFLGNGFEFPPAEYPFPSILLNQKVTRNDLINWHDQLQETLDSVCNKLSREKIKFEIKDIFSPKHGLVIANPMLDHYLSRLKKVHYLPILAEIDTEGSKLNSFSFKPSLFIYLNVETPNLLESLRLLSQYFNIEGYIPNLMPAQRNALGYIGINISAIPLSVSKVMAKSQLVVCHSGIGTVGHAIALSKPLVLIPTQVEQSMLAHHLCKFGAAVLLPKTASSHQFVNMVKTAAGNMDIMQKNIRRHREQIWEKSLIWDKDISEYIDEFF